MARGDKIVGEQVDDIEDLELVIRQAATCYETAYLTTRESRENRVGRKGGVGESRIILAADGRLSRGEPTAGYDADEVQKTIGEMEAERKAHNKAKAKKGRKKTSASARDGERERFAKRSGLCLFVTAPWSYKEARIDDDLGSDDLLAQTDKKGRTFYLLGYENRFK
ncbi:hypothetical protein FOZ63_018604, partial [Perkinsus olseni]